jgi:hypothetical protein
LTYLDPARATKTVGADRSDDELATVDDLLDLDAKAPPGPEPAFEVLDQCLVTANRVDLLHRPVFAIRVEVHGLPDVAALSELAERGVLRSDDLDVLLRHRIPHHLSKLAHSMRLDTAPPAPSGNARTAPIA